MTRIAIVGNAPNGSGPADRIDSADRVVRFNHAHGHGGVNGSRIDDLYLVNCGGQALEWLRTGSLLQRQVVRATPQITLPIAAAAPGSGLARIEAAPGIDPSGLNFEHDMRAALATPARRVVTLPPRVHDGAVAALRAFGAGRDGSRGRIAPSTGFLAIFAYLAAAPPAARVELFGFDFAGWHGHAWQAERAWVRAQVGSGRVVHVMP